MTNILFVCSRNQLRSPTGERIFMEYEGIEADSAGTAVDADCVISYEQVDVADVIFVMEQKHLKYVKTKFNKLLSNKKLICLDIPDNYNYMQPELVSLMTKKVKQHLKLKS